MIVKRVDPYTGKTNEMDLPITLDDIDKWKGGELIQRAMPHLTPDQREFLISGCTPDSFDKIFGE